MTPSGLQVSTLFASGNGLAHLGTGDMRWGDAAPGSTPSAPPCWEDMQRAQRIATALTDWDLPAPSVTVAADGEPVLSARIKPCHCSGAWEG